MPTWIFDNTSLPKGFIGRVLTRLGDWDYEPIWLHITIGQSLYIYE